MNVWGGSWGDSWGASWKEAAVASQPLRGRHRRSYRTPILRENMSPLLAKIYRELYGLKEVRAELADIVAPFSKVGLAESIPPAKVDFKALSLDIGAVNALIARYEEEEDDLLLLVA